MHVETITLPINVNTSKPPVYNIPAETLFAFDSYNLTTQALSVIDTILAANASASKIEISGHTCKIGALEYNKSLSWWRANSVKEYIEQKYPGIYVFTIRPYGSMLCNTKDTIEYKYFRRVQLEFK